MGYNHFYGLILKGFIIPEDCLSVSLIFITFVLRLTI